MSCLESSLDVMEHADLFQWLHRAKKTGLCTFEHGTATRRFYFKDGRLIATSSNEPHLLLGQFLISNGRIDLATLRRCMQLQGETGRKLGSLLVETRKISEAELRRLVAAKAVETVFGLFDWSKGTFRFEPDHQPPEDAMQVDLDVQAVLMKGIRRLDELGRLEKVFTSPHVVLHRTELAPGPPPIANYMGRKLYESINGRRTLAEIILQCRVSRYHAYWFLGRLVECGLVRLGEVLEPEIKGVHQDDGARIGELQDLLSHGEYDHALDLIERCAMRRGGHDLLGMLVARAEAGFLANAYRTQIPPEAVPRRVCIGVPRRDIAVVTSEELFLLDLIDGSWDVRSLVWISPMRKVDVVRSLMRLHRNGYIEFQPKVRALESPVRASNHRDDPVEGEEIAKEVEEALDDVFGRKT